MVHVFFGLLVTCYESVEGDQHLGALAGAAACSSAFAQFPQIHPNSRTVSEIQYFRLSMDSKMKHRKNPLRHKATMVEGLKSQIIH